MRFTLVSSIDVGGGAERCAYDLARQLHALGYDARLVVGEKLGTDPLVVELRYSSFERHVRQLCFDRVGVTDTVLASPLASCFRLPEFREADVYNIHNMHGGYWNLWALPLLARRAPVILTLHDEWLLTGDCTYSYECERWLARCGQCPQSAWPDAAERYAIGGRDLTLLNLWLKRRCLAALPRGAVSLVTPSWWLLERVRKAPHMSRFDSRQIELGVDLQVFRPCPDPRRARAELGLPQDHYVLFTAASNLSQGRKNFQMVLDLMTSSGWPSQCWLVCAGRLAPSEARSLEGLPVTLMGYIQDQDQLARIIGACDAVLLVPLADNFPYAALEALACGRPIIASRVGGLPEIVQDGTTGWLLQQGPTAWDLAQALRRVVETSQEDQRLMQVRARAAAERRFSLSRMVDAYGRLFHEYASGRKGRRPNQFLAPANPGSTHG